VIRVATLDRHPTARAGLAAVLEGEPDLLHVGAAADPGGLLALVNRTAPDVVVLDGLELCLQVAPRALVFATDPGPHALVQATLVGAQAIVDKAAPVGELLAAIRGLGAGERLLPPVTLPRQRRAAVLLAPRDRAIFAMRLAGTPTGEIAGVVGLRPDQVRTRIAGIVAVLDGVAGPDHDLLRLAA
jgi:DNA-binding NarL/FixJ family response regulator